MSTTEIPSRLPESSLCSRKTSSSEEEAREGLVQDVADGLWLSSGPETSTINNSPFCWGLSCISRETVHEQ